MKYISSGGIIKKETTRSDLQKRIEKVIMQVDENINSTIDIKELSQTACLSEFHFIRIFNEFCGCTPYQYVIKKRINRAKMLIQHNIYSVFEVSQACGYESVQTFRKCFKRETGFSPSEYSKLKQAV